MNLTPAQQTFYTDQIGLMGSDHVAAKYLNEAGLCRRRAYGWTKIRSDQSAVQFERWMTVARNHLTVARWARQQSEKTQILIPILIKLPTGGYDIRYQKETV